MSFATIKMIFDQFVVFNNINSTRFQLLFISIKYLFG